LPPFLEAKHLEIEWDSNGEKKKQKRPSPKNKESVEFFRKVFDQVCTDMTCILLLI